MEQVVCQNCKLQFAIDESDEAFYKRIAVPFPTFCPDCRLERRYAWRNERTFFKATCDFCKKDMLSAYPHQRTFPVVCHDCWFSDVWDPMSFGKDYDFSKPFFVQFKAMFDLVPRMGLFQLNAVNSPYVNIVRDVKNSYLSFSVVESEEIFYSKNIDRSRQIFDSLNVTDAEQCFWNINCARNYNVLHSVLVGGSLDSSFIYNAADTKHCFMSANLRHREYVFRHVQYTKENYERALAAIDTGSYRLYSELVREFYEMQLRHPHRYAVINQSTSSTGDILLNVKNARDSFESYDMEDVRYIGRCLRIKDSMDVNNTGFGSDLIYEYVSGGKNNHNLKFCVASLDALRDSAYAGWCGTGSNLFGCFGLRGKSYCILNKQYSEEEYKKLVPKIIQHMNDMPYTGNNGRVYRYGEFWPIELSPFARNETVAQEHFLKTKEEIELQWYVWRDPPERHVNIDIQAGDLPDHINDVTDDILGKVIGCAHRGNCVEPCTLGFRLTAPELALYRSRHLPVPRLCPNCRHYERLQWRNPWKLWRRTCQCAGVASSNGVYKNTVSHNHGDASCTNEFETSYAIDRKEIVYCETCYQNEVI